MDDGSIPSGSTMTKWRSCPYNNSRSSFAYQDYLWEQSNDDAIDGIHIDDIKDSLDNLFYVLAMLDVIWTYDSGNDGEPTVWLKK